MIKLRIISILTAICIAMCPFYGCALSENAAGTDICAADGEKAEDILDGLEKDGEIYYNPGANYSTIVSKMRNLCTGFKGNGVYLLANDDDVIFAAGLDQFETDGVTHVNVYTTYEIGSVTKTFTAVAVFQLVEDGRLSLDDTLGMFFPEYETGAKITISQLLHMRSGIYDDINEPEGFWGEDYSDQLFVDFTHDRLSDEQYLEHLYKAELQFKPGTKFSYCNTNYHLLAMIIEQLTGQTYAEYLQENIFDVCGMEHTSSMTIGNLTSAPTVRSDMELSGASLTDEKGYEICVNSSRGDGDIHSCAADLLAFDRALTSGKLIGDGSFAKMTEFIDNYGCGLIANREYKNVFGHSGATFSYLTENQIIKTNAYGNIYFINLNADGSTVDTPAATAILDSMLFNLSSK